MSLEVEAGKGANDSISNNAVSAEDIAILNNIFGELNQYYRGRKLGYLLAVFDVPKLKVIYSDPLHEARDWLLYAKIERMSIEKLEKAGAYDYKPEFKHDFYSRNENWLAMEQAFARENLKRELGREPSETEVTNKFADEILAAGKSHSRRFRAFYAMKFRDRVHPAMKSVGYHFPKAKAA